MSGTVEVIEPEYIIRPISNERLRAILELKNQLIDIIQNQLIEGVHYGSIPGNTKKILFLPGAQFLAKGYGLRGDIEGENEIVKESLIRYHFTMAIIDINTSLKIASGVGTADNEESIFRHTRRTHDIRQHAFKRAFVKGIIYSLGLSDVFMEEAPSGDTETPAITPTQTPKSQKPSQEASKAQELTCPKCGLEGSLIKNKFKKEDWHGDYVCYKKYNGCGAYLKESELSSTTLSTPTPKLYDNSGSGGDDELRRMAAAVAPLIKWENETKPLKEFVRTITGQPDSLRSTNAATTVLEILVQTGLAGLITEDELIDALKETTFLALLSVISTHLDEDGTMQSQISRYHVGKALQDIHVFSAREIPV